MKEQSKQISSETGSDDTAQSQRKNIHAELKAGLEKGKEALEKSKGPLSEVVLQPESRKYMPGDKFTFLVHVPLQGVGERAQQLGTEEFRLLEPLNTSLIDQEHTWTF